MCCLTSYSRIFRLYGNVTIAGKGLQAKAYARYLLPLSRRESLSCLTYTQIRDLGFCGLEGVLQFSLLLRQARGSEDIFLLESDGKFFSL